MSLLIENIVLKNSHSFPNKRAALYYKTEPFYTDVNRYVHTNNWEILKSIEVLNEKGFIVDLIDRNNNSWRPNKKYDLFLGLGAGNSGKNFARYSELSKAKARVLLAMGPQPDVSNELVLKRYEMFYKRTGHYAPPMRTVTEVTGQKFIEIIENTDFIFSVGEKNTASYNSYVGYKKPVLNFYPAVSPAVFFDDSWRKRRDQNQFLCFAGNGFICKGVDMVLESFLKDETKFLHICGPEEQAFFSYYGSKIKNSKNIKYHGFIQPGASVFNELASKCSFVVFHSSSEGCCTSVATSIRAGLVPIINPWTGLNVEDVGIEMSDDGDIIEIISKSVEKARKIEKENYDIMLDKTLKKSELFTQKSYEESYSSAIDEVIKFL